MRALATAGGAAICSQRSPALLCWEQTVGGGTSITDGRLSQLGLLEQDPGRAADAQQRLLTVLETGDRYQGIIAGRILVQVAYCQLLVVPSVGIQ